MHKPIIVPRNKKYGNNYWSSVGPKVNFREVILYSDLEFDHWVMIETDPTVKTYCEQPIEISFVVDGKLHKSIIDMWISRTNGMEEYVEIKYEVELQPKHRNFTRNMRQIKAQQEWCKKEGFSHKVMTEKTIRAFPIGLENRLKILTFMKNQSNPDSKGLVLQFINDEPQTIGQIQEKLSGHCSIEDIMNSCYWLTYIWGNLSQY